MTKYSFGKTIVVALGGSIVHPDTIDTEYLKSFKKFVEKFIKTGTRFVIVVGGGRLARNFQKAAHEVSPLADEDKDWIGIHSTRLHGHLLRTIFRLVADPVVFDHRGKIKKLKYPVTIASGWRPGWSTDFVAAAIAKDFRIPEYVVAGKPSHVFSKDPSLHKGATPFDAIGWREYRKLIPKKWKPGAHSPVDPVAAKLSNTSGLKAIIVNGKDLKNFEKLLRGKEFKGTVIS